ncbi:MAG: ABC-2 transporter permease [Peptococcaceae bacterium]|nr:ABC-2 transporter permease [Peptococcaceae bacterium]
MKALFIQDFRYMLTQKSFLVLIALVGIVLALTQNDNYIFVIGYLGFMGMITGMMSVTMDDQSNGLTFLFSLPIDRRVYVREKYIFIVLMGVSFSIFATALCLLFRMFAEYKAPLDEILATSLGTLFVMLLFVCFMLPLQLKFGAERARLASFIAIGLFFAAVIVAGLVVNFADALPFIQAFLSLSPVALTGIAVAFLIVCLRISYGVSLRIILRREF